MAKQQSKKTKSKYVDYMSNIDRDGSALSSAQKILSNGSKQAVSLNKKVSKEAASSTKKIMNNASNSAKAVNKKISVDMKPKKK